MFPIENILSHYKEEKSYTFQFQSNLEKLDTITLHTTQVMNEFERMNSLYL